MEFKIPEEIEVKDRWNISDTKIKAERGESLVNLAVDIAREAIKNAPICDGVKRPCPKEFLVTQKTERWLRRSIERGKIKLEEWKHRRVFLVLIRAGNEFLALSTSAWFRRWNYGYPTNKAVTALTRLLQDINPTGTEASPKEIEIFVNALAIRAVYAGVVIPRHILEGVVIPPYVLKPPLVREDNQASEDDQASGKSVPSFSFVNANQI
jgi:hypothetical protein